MLLVDDDEAERGDGREDGGAGADADLRDAVAQAAPLLGPLAVVECGVEDGDLVAEARLKLAGGGGGECDFGDEEQSAAAEREGGFDGAEIDLGFAGAGDAVEEEGLVLGGMEGALDLGEGGELGGAELMARLGPGGVAGEGDGRELEELAAGEGAGGLGGVLNGLVENLQIVCAGVEFEIGDEFAFGFGELDAGGAALELDAEAGGGGRGGGRARRGFVRVRRSPSSPGTS